MCNPYSFVMCKLLLAAFNPVSAFLTKFDPHEKTVPDTGVLLAGFFSISFAHRIFVGQSHTACAIARSANYPFIVVYPAEPATENTVCLVYMAFF